MVWPESMGTANHAQLDILLILLQKRVLIVLLTVNFPTEFVSAKMDMDLIAIKYVSDVVIYLMFSCIKENARNAQES
jgi:hypothetical protein